MQITAVRSNLKGGVSAALTALTLVRGPNRARKTAIFDALRLGIIGKHPIGPHPADLLRLAPDGRELVVEIESTAGRVLFEVSKKGRGGSKPKVTREGDLATLTPDDLNKVFPLDAVSELLTLGPARAREAIFRRFGGPNGLGVPDGLVKDRIKLWTDVAGLVGGDDVAARLSGMSVEFRRRKRQASDRAAELCKLEEEAAQAANAAVPSADAVEAARARLDRARRAAEGAATRNRHDALAAQLAREVAMAKSLRPTDTEAGDGDDITRQIDERNASINDLTARLARAEAFLAMTAEGTTSCPACGGKSAETLTKLHGRREQAVAARAERQQQIAALRGEIGQLRGTRQAVASALAMFNAAKDTARRTKAALDEVERALAGVPVEPMTIQDAEESLRAVTAAREAAGTRGQLSVDRRAAERAFEDWKALEKESGALLATLLDETRTRAAAAVNRYMPEGFTARLIIDETTPRWEVIGADGIPHPIGAMSGSERASLTIGLACAWTEGAPLRALLLDDTDVGMFDTEGFMALLARIEFVVDAKHIGQAVVCSTRTTDPPSTWSIIDMPAPTFAPTVFDEDREGYEGVMMEEPNGREAAHVVSADAGDINDIFKALDL